MAGPSVTFRRVGRRARDDEVASWQAQGWVLLEGIVGADEIDAAALDLRLVFPTAAEFHADPERTRERWLGHPAPAKELFTWPPDGPGFRPEQHTWRHEFPFPGSGALNRLCVDPGIVDFCERALGSEDLRIYQAQVSAKYAGETNYEQPIHTDRNHSWLPSLPGRSSWHVEGFLYLCDVDAGNAPTHLVTAADARGRDTMTPLIMPASDPAIYAAERAAPGPRGSYLAYRSDAFHRGVDLVDPGAARFLLNLSFKLASCDWVGYEAFQSRATSPYWVAFAAGLTPRQLSLWGFPPPGDPIWDDELLSATGARYPGLDLAPWRAALS